MNTFAGNKWRENLEKWGIPEAILKQAPTNPWIHPVDLFLVPNEIVETFSHTKAREVNPETVLDIGCGGGIAAFALVPPATKVFGIDHQPEMLVQFDEEAKRRNVDSETHEGFWPEISEKVAKADVVVSHHVLFNVKNIEEFLLACHSHATKRVVIEIPEKHPQSDSNFLWKHFWGLERPNSPKAHDIIDTLAELGIETEIRFWEGKARATTDLSKKVEYARIRLCLDSSKDEEIKFLLEAQESAPRKLATIWWDK